MVRTRQARGQSFETIVNEALRSGLRAMEASSAQSVAYRTSPVDLDRCRVGSVNDVTDALAVAEGEEFR